MLINTSKNPVTFTLVLLAAVGAINWGLIGLLEFNLVSYLLGDGKVANLVYTLVGVSGVYLLISAVKTLSGPSITLPK